MQILTNIEQAEKSITALDHLANVTFPIVNDKKLLLKIIVETNTAIKKIISSILQYEYVYKKIKLTKDPKTNFRIFIEKCAPKYQINKQEIESIIRLIELVKKHNQSPMEFKRNDKLVILSENLEHETLTIEDAKKFLKIAKEILKKQKITISKNLRKI